MPRKPTTYTIGKFEGDREEKSADVMRNGERIGYISVRNDSVFISPASMVRVWKFSYVELVLFDSDDTHEWHASGGCDRAAGIRCAKAVLDSLPA